MKIEVGRHWKGTRKRYWTKDKSALNLTTKFLFRLDEIRVALKKVTSQIIREQETGMEN